MTRKDLSEIHHLNREIKVLNRLIRNYDEEHPIYHSPQVTGMPSGGAGGNPLEDRAVKKAAFLEEVVKLRKQLIDKQVVLMRFIQTIPDSYLRSIIELYCIEDLPWFKVAMELGSTEDSIKKYYYRHIDSYLEVKTDAIV